MCITILVDILSIFFQRTDQCPSALDSGWINVDQTQNPGTLSCKKTPTTPGPTTHGFSETAGPTTDSLSKTTTDGLSETAGPTTDGLSETAGPTTDGLPETTKVITITMEELKSINCGIQVVLKSTHVFLAQII